MRLNKINLVSGVFKAPPPSALLLLLLLRLLLLLQVLLMHESQLIPLHTELKTLNRKGMNIFFSIYPGWKDNQRKRGLGNAVQGRHHFGGVEEGGISASDTGTTRKGFIF